MALIVDDDRSERRTVAALLKSTLELSSQEVENGQEALNVLEGQKSDFALIILDLEMPVMNGMQTLGQLKKNFPHIPVIILTGSTRIDDVVKVMKAGATDFLPKPIDQPRFEVSVRNALKISLMGQEISRLQRHGDDKLHFSDLIGHDSGLQDPVKIARKAAASNLPVLITGETGTGKELFARAIHGESERAGQNFVAVNCGAIPEKLVESTLFGHEKGAFTGAVQKASGKFLEASGGTIFLDEVGELPLDAQVKLLRVLQQQEIEPVGANKHVPIDVRVISATNRDLTKEVQEGRFREDLFFRLNVLHLDLPALRTRKGDIPGMVQFFTDKFCSSNHALPKGVSQDALDKMAQYAWPGNVRELENVIYRSLALSEGDILKADDIHFIQLMEDRPLEQSKRGIQPTKTDGSFKSFKELEQEIIALALAHHNHNITQTARTLGIAKSTLYSKMEALADARDINIPYA